jgi:type I restriction enzyme S subunit
MITDCKPYPAYKDSSIPWLGEVPEHWRLRRTKTVLRERVQKGFPDEPLLAATQTKGVVRKEHYENRTVLALKDLHLLKLVRMNDFVISLRSFQGGIEYAREQGIISPAYTILYTAQQENHRFLAWLFKSKPYIENLSLYVTGIRQGQNIDYDKLSRSSLPLPPSQEQTAIVRFLDHADRKIRRYIRAKKKLIKLLEEQKQAIIHRAVTRGLDPNVRLKPSGVEWLRDIPEHWKLIRFKFVAEKIVDCLHATPKYSEDGEFPAIRTADISPGTVNLSSARRIEADEYERWVERLVPKPRDILYSREGERFGIAACVPDGSRLCISQRMMVFRIRPEHNPVFIMWLLNSKEIYAQACQDVMGATAPHVNVSTIRNYYLAVPDRKEQDSLVVEIVNATKGYSNIIDHAQCEISLLQEYRTRLISEVVTGKIDVREAALKFPAEANAEEADMPEEDEMNDAGMVTENVEIEE